MIVGIVSDEGRPLIRLHVKGQDEEEIEAWLDTGFDGFLMLPLEIVRRLGLEVSVVVDIELADGSQVEAQSYDAVINWQGQLHQIQVIETQGRMLAGLRLLRNQELRVWFSSGGAVQIEPLE